MDGDETEPNRNIIIVSEPNRELLTEKEHVDYYEYRKSLLTWLLKFGKNPQRASGYSPYSVYSTGYRTAAFDRWVWQQDGHYVAPPTQEHASAFMEETAYSDVSDSTKGKQLEMLRRYSKWLQEQHGADKWEFPWTFTSGGGNNAPRDFLSLDERRKIRQAALAMDGNPAYGVEDTDALAVTDCSWKFTSIVWTSLDAALRPVEVGRAKVGWVDTENGVLRIPREESSKNEGNWTVSLTDRTTTALSRWLEERAEHPHYEDTDQLWLTRHRNKYGANELRRLLHKLCDDAEIDHTHRQMSWYTIRHSVGTYMTKERDLAATKAQLRHRNAKTTMKYDQVPVEDRRDALNRMG
ncbi:tyrosine-type recombinase/integrase [Haloprofundus salilacus]|uniref:tyrosine-type recombinase/integrase n=1 Tax=Haloprofundus salilacus TaxID=2876190 RepID=UPI001CCDF7D4|nr:site-specific integrase [Haloprofundus salilacus]